MLKQGIISNQFSHIQSLESLEEPEHVVQVIDTYLIDVETILSELTSYMDRPEVDFSTLATLSHKVEERSLRLYERIIYLYNI
ncbi:hypothetical protein I3843_13G121700 [Carya illinoinensis]|nr:hypothetical protein I3843_13G121700 [Carya illinoinensis]